MDEDNDPLTSVTRAAQGRIRRGAFKIFEPASFLRDFFEALLLRLRFVP